MALRLMTSGTACEALVLVLANTFALLGTVARQPSAWSVRPSHGAPSHSGETVDFGLGQLRSGDSLIGFLRPVVPTSDAGEREHAHGGGVGVWAVSTSDLGERDGECDGFGSSSARGSGRSRGTLLAVLVARRQVVAVDAEQESDGHGGGLNPGRHVSEVGLRRSIDRLEDGLREFSCPSSATTFPAWMMVGPRGELSTARSSWIGLNLGDDGL